MYSLLTKKELRKSLLQTRRAIPRADRTLAAESAMRLLTEAELFRKSQHVACYLARDDEFDCMPLMNKILQEKKHCYLPVIVPGENQLEFAAYDPNQAMQPNRFRILEPVNTPKIPVEELDLILMPLVGFDLQGNRLGMGGGYYDRALRSLRENHKKCHLIGLAFAVQYVPELPRDEWDVLLDGVVTEQSLCLFNEE